MEKRLMILMLLTMALSAFADIITLKPDVDQSRDATVSARFPNSNLDGSGTLLIYPISDTYFGQRSFYLHFDELDDYLGWSLTSAELRLYVTGYHDSCDWAAAAAAANWNESNITWNNQPGSVGDTAITFTSPTEAESWFSIDVKLIVREWLNLSLNHYGFHLYHLNTGDGKWGASAADANVDHTYHPELILDIEDSAVEPVSWGAIKALE